MKNQNDCRFKSTQFLVSPTQTDVNEEKKNAKMEYDCFSLGQKRFTTELII